MTETLEDRITGLQSQVDKLTDMVGDLQNAVASLGSHFVGGKPGIAAYLVWHKTQTRPLPGSTSTGSTEVSVSNASPAAGASE